MPKKQARSNVRKKTPDSFWESPKSGSAPIAGCAPREKRPNSPKEPARSSSSAHPPERSPVFRQLQNIRNHGARAAQRGEREQHCRPADEKCVKTAKQIGGELPGYQLPPVSLDSIPLRGREDAGLNFPDSSRPGDGAISPLTLTRPSAGFSIPGKAEKCCPIRPVPGSDRFSNNARCSNVRTGSPSPPSQSVLATLRLTTQEAPASGPRSTPKRGAEILPCPNCF